MEKSQGSSDTTFGDVRSLPRNQARKNELPKAVELGQHLSDLAKNRKPSPLKTFFQYYGKPGVLALAGGLPPAEYFPFDTLEANTLPFDAFPASPEAAMRAESGAFSWLWNLFHPKDKQRTDHIIVNKYVADPIKDINLAATLQYNQAKGIPQLQVFLQDYTARFFDPAYSDFTVLVHTGNTDGWSRVAYTLLNNGDGLLVEEFTYPSTLATSFPLGAHTVGIPMDSQGMRPDALEQVLANWNEDERGFKRPHVLYTVGIGQNPSGLTTGAERKKAIYDICVKYDIIICEDDPYFILQAGNYIPKKQREEKARQASTSFGSSTINLSDEIQQFIDTLVPSYLKFDYQGRVVRLDTFSKTIAPGSRLGWFTCSPQLAERFERQGETSTQNPCGFGQSMIAQLVTKQWGLSGYVRWLKGIRTQYTIRRNALLDAFMDTFDIIIGAGDGYREGAIVYEASLKQGRGLGSFMVEKRAAKVLSFVAPTSGMFLWLEVHFDTLQVPTPDELGENHEMRFWTALASNSLLILPGFAFLGDQDHPSVNPNKIGHYRISFSDTSTEQMKIAIEILAKVIAEYFKF